MIKNIITKIVMGLSIGVSLIAVSCEHSDSGNVGNNIIPGQPTGDVANIDVIAYNLGNNDTLRSDTKVLKYGVLGVYNDATFGKSNASFATEIKLADTGLEGTERRVDSVMLSLRANFDTSKGEEKTIEKNGYTYKTTTYPITTYLGSEIPMDVVVKRVNTVLHSETPLYSDINLNEDTELGSATIKPEVQGIEVRNSNNEVVANIKPGMNIPLDAKFFQDNFITSLPADDEALLSKFKGLIVSPKSDNPAFLFSFATELTVYYSYRNNSSEEYTNATYAFNMDKENGKVGKYKLSGASGQVTSQISSPNKNEGEEVLYLQGMGGPSIGLKLDEAQVSAIKDSIQNKGWIIAGANLKFYLAKDTEDRPTYIYAYNNTKKAFLSDIEAFSGMPGYEFNPAYSEFYQLNVTQHIKDILEKNMPNDEVKVDMGNFLSTNGKPIDYFINSRAYEPYGISLFGNKASNEAKKLKLEIIYNKN